MKAKTQLSYPDWHLRGSRKSVKLVWSKSTTLIGCQRGEPADTGFRACRGCGGSSQVISSLKTGSSTSSLEDTPSSISCSRAGTASGLWPKLMAGWMISWRMSAFSQALWRSMQAWISLRFKSGLLGIFFFTLIGFDLVELDLTLFVQISFCWELFSLNVSSYRDTFGLSV